MVKFNHGRAESILSETERLGSIENMINSLTASEKEALISLIQEADKGTPLLYNLLTEVEYRHPLVDIETFLRDPYYFGHIFDSLYPKWVDDLIELFSNDYDVVILTGAIGTGKTTFGKIVISRILYEMSCLRDPLLTYGLMPGSTIVFPVINITQKQAQNAIFNDLHNMIMLSGYFRDHFKPDKRADELLFPNNIFVILGSYSDSRFIGLNVFSAMLDECNFYASAQSSRAKEIYDISNLFDSAEALFISIERRRKSRYLKSGVLPGKIIISSSKKVNDEFTERKILEYRENPRVFVRDYAQWDVKPKRFFMPTNFYVLIGDAFVKSRIISESEIDKYRDNPSVKVIKVPDDFKPDFERDIDGAIRDIAGMATHAINPFIRYGLEKCVELSKKHNYTHPFTSEAFVQGSADTFIWSKLIQYADGGCVPLLSPEAPRFVHIDTSYRGDFTGICMGHVLGHKEIIRKIGGEIFSEVVPVYFIDLFLRVSASETEDIIFGDVRKLIYSLSEHGFFIDGITVDSFQSRDYIQHFEKKGYKCEVLSVDRSTGPYEVLRQAIYEERVIMYPYRPVIDELKKLEYRRDSNKIDHPKKNGYKDISDALAGVVWNLSHNAGSSVNILSDDNFIKINQPQNQMENYEQYSDFLFDRQIMGDRKVLYNKEMLPDDIKDLDNMFIEPNYNVGEFFR